MLITRRLLESSKGFRGISMTKTNAFGAPCSLKDSRLISRLLESKKKSTTSSRSSELIRSRHSPLHLSLKKSAKLEEMKVLL